MIPPVSAPPATVDAPWPALLRLRPRRVIAAAATLVITAWVVFLAVDIANLGGVGDQLPKPMWTYLFNDHLVEVSQWFVYAVLILAAGYLAGRLAGGRYAGAATFFFLIGLGLGFMLVEESGDIRHAISGAVRLHLGETVAGLPYQVFSDVPYFAALATLPLYAVLRHGRHVWRVPSIRPYLVTSVTLYAFASIGSGLRHLGDLYSTLGAGIDRVFFGGRFPAAPDQTQERAHYFVVDGLIEESVELFAVCCMFAVVLAFAAHVRAQRPAALAAAPPAAPVPTPATSPPAPM